MLQPSKNTSLAQAMPRTPPAMKGRGTLHERACKFIQSLNNGKATVRIAYWHSLLGAELIAAGFVVDSREYACPGIADPFRLPRLLRNLAAFQSVARILMIQLHTHTHPPECLYSWSRTIAPLHAAPRTNPSGSRPLLPRRTNATRRTPLRCETAL
jgi:hypothetical protein